MPLRDRVAIVTGSSRGIGRATVRALVDAGARALVHGSTGKSVDDVVAQCPERVLGVVGPIEDPEVPQRLVDTAVSAWGRVDIVVNNAGYSWDAPLATMTDEQFRAMFEVHLFGAFRLLRAAAPHLLAPNGSAPNRKVVNVTSIAGTMGNAGQANYNAAKAGLIGLTKGLAREWGPAGVNVNALAPGFIDTRLTAEAVGDVVLRGANELPLGIPADRRAEAIDRIPLGRFGSVAEAADGILFLASPMSDYVHGQVLSVTGGLAHGMVA